MFDPVLQAEMEAYHSTAPDESDTFETHVISTIHLSRNDHYFSEFLFEIILFELAAAIPSTKISHSVRIDAIHWAVKIAQGFTRSYGFDSKASGTEPAPMYELYIATAPYAPTVEDCYHYLVDEWRVGRLFTKAVGFDRCSTLPSSKVPTNVTIPALTQEDRNHFQQQYAKIRPDFQDRFATIVYACRKYVWKNNGSGGEVVFLANKELYAVEKYTKKFNADYKRKIADAAAAELISSDRAANSGSPSPSNNAGEGPSSKSAKKKAKKKAKKAAAVHGEQDGDADTSLISTTSQPSLAKGTPSVAVPTSLAAEEPEEEEVVDKEFEATLRRVRAIFVDMQFSGDDTMTMINKANEWELAQINLLNTISDNHNQAERNRHRAIEKARQTVVAAYKTRQDQEQWIPASIKRVCEASAVYNKERARLDANLMDVRADAEVRGKEFANSSLSTLAASMNAGGYPTKNAKKKVVAGRSTFNTAIKNNKLAKGKVKDTPNPHSEGFIERELSLETISSNYQKLSERRDEDIELFLDEYIPVMLHKSMSNGVPIKIQVEFCTRLEEATKEDIEKNWNYTLSTRSNLALCLNRSISKELIDNEQSDIIIDAYDVAHKKKKKERDEIDKKDIQSAEYFSPAGKYFNRLFLAADESGSLISDNDEQGDADDFMDYDSEDHNPTDDDMPNLVSDDETRTKAASTKTPAKSTASAIKNQAKPTAPTLTAANGKTPKASSAPVTNGKATAKEDSTDDEMPDLVSEADDDSLPDLVTNDRNGNKKSKAGVNGVDKGKSKAGVEVKGKADDKDKDKDKVDNKTNNKAKGKENGAKGSRKPVPVEELSYSSDGESTDDDMPALRTDEDTRVSANNDSSSENDGDCTDDEEDDELPDLQSVDDDEDNDERATKGAIAARLSKVNASPIVKDVIAEAMERIIQAQKENRAEKEAIRVAQQVEDSRSQTLKQLDRQQLAEKTEKFSKSLLDQAGRNQMAQIAKDHASEVAKETYVQKKATEDKDWAQMDAEYKASVEADRVAKAGAEKKALQKLEAEKVTQLKTERLAKEKAEAERIAKEKAERLVREKMEADRIGKEKAERLAREKAEADRIAKEKAERLAREKAEADRIAREKAEAERLAREKVKAEKIAREKAEAERVAREKAERLAREKVEADRIAKERAEAERAAREKAEAERVAREKAEAERLAREKAEAERLAREMAEAERLAKEKAEAERLARELTEAEKVAREAAEKQAREKAEAERLAREDAEKLAREKAEADRLAREKTEADRIAREQAEADRVAKEKIEADRIAREQAEADHQAKAARVEILRQDLRDAIENEVQMIESTKDTINTIILDQSMAKNLHLRTEETMAKQEAEWQETREKAWVEKMTSYDLLKTWYDREAFLTIAESERDEEDRKAREASNTRAVQWAANVANSDRGFEARFDAVQAMIDPLSRTREAAQQALNKAEEEMMRVTPAPAEQISESGPDADTFRTIVDGVQAAEDARVEAKRLKAEKAKTVAVAKAELARQKEEVRMQREEAKQQKRLESREKTRLKQEAEKAAIELAKSLGEPVRVPTTSGDFLYDWQSIRFDLPLWKLPVEHLSTMETWVEHWYPQLTSDEESLLERQELLARLQALFDAQFPDAGLQLRPFGSYVTGLGNKFSDIDICISVEPERFHPYAPHSDVRHLAWFLETQQMLDVVAITDAKVPIVKFVDPITEIHCDMNVQHPLGIYNSALIKAYMDIDIRLEKFLFMLKYFAKAHGILDGSSGFLCSYAYILMAIVFFQEQAEPILPRLQVKTEKPKPFTEKGKSRRKVKTFGQCLQDDTIQPVYVNQDGKMFDCTFDTRIDLYKGFGDLNKKSVSRLLFEFFEYFSRKFDYRTMEVSTQYGRMQERHVISREKRQLVAANKLLADGAINNSSLLPANGNHNVGPMTRNGYSYDTKRQLWVSQADIAYFYELEASGIVANRKNGAGIGSPGIGSPGAGVPPSPALSTTSTMSTTSTISSSSTNLNTRSNQAFFCVMDPFIFNRNVGGTCRGQKLEKVWRCFDYGYRSFALGEFLNAFEPQEFEMDPPLQQQLQQQDSLPYELNDHAFQETRALENAGEMAAWNQTLGFENYNPQEHQNLYIEILFKETDFDKPIAFAAIPLYQVRDAHGHAICGCFHFFTDDDEEKGEAYHPQSEIPGIFELDWKHPAHINSLRHKQQASDAGTTTFSVVAMAGAKALLRSQNKKAEREI
ncbi:hypothetical protein BGZ47_008091 [Haplosporangium gracile]|nr:hypothetical protein BGZ47_008091 [Haplosporangium gracile]